MCQPSVFIMYEDYRVLKLASQQTQTRFASWRECETRMNDRFSKVPEIVEDYQTKGHPSSRDDASWMKV